MPARQETSRRNDFPIINVSEITRAPVVERVHAKNKNETHLIHVFRRVRNWFDIDQCKTVGRGPNRHVLELYNPPPWLPSSA